MKNEYVYTIPGTPLNYNQFNYLNQREWNEQSAKLASLKTLLDNQHNDQPPITGKLTVQIYFYLPSCKQNQRQQLIRSHGIFNLLRFVQRVTENKIIAKAAYIKSFESFVLFSHEPRTVIIINKELI